jgi:hypothetical protein
MRCHTALPCWATLTALAVGCLGAATTPISPPTTGAAAPTPSAAAAEDPAAGSGRIALARRNGFLVAPVTIGGRPAGDFLVDTGAGATLIDRGLADRLALPHVMEVSLQGALFADTAEIRELHGLAAGGVALVAGPTLAIDLTDISASVGGAVTGIIGFPTFGAAPFTVDFVAATLTVHDPTRFQPPDGVASELVRVNQVPYVEATIENGIGVWLQLDTGSLFAVTLWREFVKANADVLTVPQKRWVQTTGFGGSAQVMESEIRSLHVLGRDYSKVPVIIQDAPEQSWRHPRVAGRVGIGLLEDCRVTLHPTRRRMWVER